MSLHTGLDLLSENIIIICINTEKLEHITFLLTNCITTHRFGHIICLYNHILCDQTIICVDYLPLQSQPVSPQTDLNKLSASIITTCITTYWFRQIICFNNHKLYHHKLIRTHYLPLQSQTVSPHTEFGLDFGQTEAEHNSI